ncbi:MAG: sulfate/molybdate ABC transporter ATP-binding protein [Magnetococcus sp. DMHC-1]|nr:sulfate/molybdate ABC transporter ATP-binding protein [Magnetococcales bacterium]
MIEIRSITKTFTGGIIVLNDVSLKIKTGELLALLGPSGSGKTTLLRIIAGLEKPDRGEIHFDTTDATRLSARERQVGFVFQHYALFRHLTVFENIAFGLRARPRASRPDQAEIRRRVEQLLELVQIGFLAERYPSQLSGGQRQRVALARALAIEPKLLLLDEPFGALDAKVRRDLRRWLRNLHDTLGITGVFVTHDQEEAMEVADRVVVMNQGRIEQVDTPTRIYDHPASAFVYQFLGNVNTLACRIRNGLAETDIGLTLPAAEYASIQDAPGTIFIRPHDLEFTAPGQPGSFPVLLGHQAILGPIVRLELQAISGQVLEAELSRSQHKQLSLRSGDRLGVRPRRAQLYLSEGVLASELGVMGGAEIFSPPIQNV